MRINTQTKPLYPIQVLSSTQKRQNYSKNYLLQNLNELPQELVHQFGGFQFGLEYFQQHVRYTLQAAVQLVRLPGFTSPDDITELGLGHLIA